MVDRIPSFQVSAALPENALVKLSAGKLALCAAADTNCIGSTMRQTFAADDWVSVRPLHDNGTHRMIAAGAVAVGDVVNQAANGQVQSGAGTVQRGIALTAATAAGDYIDVMPRNV